MTDTAVVATPKSQLTQFGYEDIEKELLELESVRLPSIIKRVEAARAYGDLSENSEYHSAKEDQELIETRMAELKSILANSTIVKNTRKQSTIGVGSAVVVSVKSKKSQRKTTLHIVGEFEADPKVGKISTGSPIGKALYGKKKGDVVEVKAPSGTVLYEVLDID